MKLEKTARYLKRVKHEQDNKEQSSSRRIYMRTVRMSSKLVAYTNSSDMNELSEIAINVWRR